MIKETKTIIKILSNKTVSIFRQDLLNLLVEQKQDWIIEKVFNAKPNYKVSEVRLELFKILLRSEEPKSVRQLFNQFTHEVTRSQFTHEVTRTTLYINLKWLTEIKVLDQIKEKRGKGVLLKYQIRKPKQKKERESK